MHDIPQLPTQPLIFIQLHRNGCITAVDASAAAGVVAIGKVPAPLHEVNGFSVGPGNALAFHFELSAVVLSMRC
ncbi:hypothetical protein D3C86_2104840 [compost metagenome]